MRRRRVNRSCFRTLAARENAYQEFLAKYAAIEDKTRDVLVKIIAAQKTLVVCVFSSLYDPHNPAFCDLRLQALSVRKHQETVEHTLDLEEGQHEGIEQIKQTCRGMQPSCGKTDWPLCFVLLVRRFRFCRYDGRVHEGLTFEPLRSDADARYVLCLRCSRACSTPAYSFSRDSIPTALLFLVPAFMIFLCPREDDNSMRAPSSATTSPGAV